MTLDNLRLLLQLQILNCLDNRISELDNLRCLQILNCGNNLFIYDFEPTLENIRVKQNRIYLEHNKI